MTAAICTLNAGPAPESVRVTSKLRVSGQRSEGALKLPLSDDSQFTATWDIDIYPTSSLARRSRARM